MSIRDRILPTPTDNIDPRLFQLPTVMESLHRHIETQTHLLERIAESLQESAPLEPDSDSFALNPDSTTECSRSTSSTLRIINITISGATAGLYRLLIGTSDKLRVYLPANGTYDANRSGSRALVVQRGLRLRVIGPAGSNPECTLQVIPQG